MVLADLTVIKRPGTSYRIEIIDMYLILDSALLLGIEAGSTSYLSPAAMLNGPLEWPHGRSEDYKFEVQQYVVFALKRLLILEDRNNSDKHQFHLINLQSSLSRGAIQHGRQSKSMTYFRLQF